MMNAVGIVFWQVLWFSLDLFLMEGFAFTLSTLFQRNAPGEDELVKTKGGNPFSPLPPSPLFTVKTKGSEFIQPPTALEEDAEKANRVVELINVSKKYGSFSAVDHIDVKIYSGEIFALLGHNGAGKTTTFNMLKICCVQFSPSPLVLAFHLVLHNFYIYFRVDIQKNANSLVKRTMGMFFRIIMSYMGAGRFFGCC